MKKLKGLLVASLLLSVTVAQAELQPRLDGQAYFDTELNVTWLTNANLADSDDLGVAVISASGQMNWETALAYIAALNDASYLGVNTWRLPHVSPINGVDWNTAWSEDGSTDRSRNITAPGSAYPGSGVTEMAHLYFNTLGNLSTRDVNGDPTICSDAAISCLANTAAFENIEPYKYWSGVEYVDDAAQAWVFDFNGLQVEDDKLNTRFVWPVFDGDPLAETHNIAINIRPFSKHNRIRPGSRMQVPVAVLSTSIADGDATDFDATQVDPATVTFGPHGAQHASFYRWGVPRAVLFDVDRDGDLDAIFIFRISETGIEEGATTAILAGQTYSGQDISGEDAIDTISHRYHRAHRFYWGRESHRYCQSEHH